MKEAIHNMLGDNVADSIEGIVNYLDEHNLTSKQIVEKIENLPETIRGCMHLLAISENKKELADKIKTANRLISEKVINNFKQAVAQGNHEEFLATLTLADKSALIVDMDLFVFEDPLKNHDVSIEKKYYDIIQASIEKEIKPESFCQDFSHGHVGEFKRYRRHHKNSN